MLHQSTGYVQRNHYLCSVAATAIHRRPRVSDSHLVSDLARLCTEMGIASQTVKACAQSVLLLEVISRANARVLTSGTSSTRCSIASVLCYRQAVPRSSSIVKIGCWPDASRISQSVVQTCTSLLVLRWTPRCYDV
ncbi:uncharacterized protein TNCV_3863441 [Trichonephila clavipes]|uniref:Uncharacterized protein n=1 Tax=Trichonephila clavipes TaxID=2585209 RepID=A0A8X6S7D6_TRICX|nr:uncharacterized protein TNCV_3863441 [Trichonephila clavipes]